MKFTKLLILLGVLSIILYSCSSLKEAGDAIRNNKNISKDEFFIKKKEPLTQPPDFRKIPKPGSIKNQAEKDQDDFEKIFKKNKSKSSTSETRSSTTEASILNKIK